MGIKIRGIRTQEEIDKKKRMNQIIVGGVLIFILVLSTAGFAFFSNPNSSQQPGNEKINYNEYDFKKGNNGFWEFQIEGQTFSTIYNPYETENITLDFQTLINNYYGRPIYFILSNPAAADEINRNIGRYASRWQEACLLGEKCESNFAIKNCTDNIFVFKETNYTKIYKKESCIFIEAPYDEQEKVSDRLIFKMFGVQ